MLVTAGLGLKSNYLVAWYHTGKLLRSYELHFEDLGNLQQYNSWVVCIYIYCPLSSPLPPPPPPPPPPPLRYVFHSNVLAGLCRQKR